MNGAVERFKSSSPMMKTAIIAVIAIWLVAMATIIISVIFLWQAPIAAEPPDFGSANPTIRVEPSSGALGSPITISGLGWQPGNLVTLYLAHPEEPATSGYTLNSVLADGQGQFIAMANLPSDGQWQGVARVVARTTTGELSAEAFFNFSGPLETATATTTLIADQPTTATATATGQPATATSIPQPGIPLATLTTDLNVRSGPGTDYLVVGLLKSGQTAEITGVSSDRKWWQIKFAGTADGRGWLTASYVNAQNTLNVPIVEPPSRPPTATPTPTSVVITDWRGEYYTNASLNGRPVLVRNDAAVNFDWGNGSPANGIPVDNFSARWTRNQSFSAGSYRFTVKADDGVRFWVDNNLLIDEWHDSSNATYTKEFYLGEGWHSLKLEYYERGYAALVQLSWSRIESYPDWKAEFYNNLKLEGNPTLVRNDAKIDFEWGNGSPATGLNNDNFSARWTRKASFDKAIYRFTLTVDDGARVWLDDALLFDNWQDGQPRTIEVDKGVTAGEHRLKVEYYEHSGAATLKFRWAKVADNQAPQAVPGGPYTGNEGAQLSFDGRSSRDPDGTIVKYEWDFTYNGSNFDSEATGTTPSYRYADGPAKVQAALRVTDDKGVTHIATTSVTINNVAPTVEAGGPYNGQVGNAISLAGTAADPSSSDQASLTYRWEFGDGASTNGQTVSHAYSQAGQYTVRLTVTDKDGGSNSDIATVTVTKVNQPPQAVIDGPSQGKVNQTLTFRGNGSTDDGSIVNYTWNFGDGTILNGVEVNHAYTKAGDYQLTLTVTDNDGASDGATITVHIEDEIVINLPPTVVLNGPRVGKVGEALAFDGSQSVDPEGTSLAWVWNFGDDAIEDGATATHTYDQVGEYTVTLIVTDETGLSNQATQTVVISE